MTSSGYFLQPTLSEKFTENTHADTRILLHDSHMHYACVEHAGDGGLIFL